MKKPEIENNRITIPSSQEFLPDVDNFVEGFLKKAGLDKSTIADIAISVTEMVINCITHGNQSDAGKTVSVAVIKNESEVEIHITDEGLGFNPDQVENPIDEKNLLREVGRGIFITKTLMDNVDFEVTPSHGTKVILTKKYSR